MAPQNDFIIDNQNGASFRQDLNSALEALAGFSSGPVAPTVTYAHQYWADTTNNILQQRNAANSAWIAIRDIDPTYGTAGQVLTSTGPSTVPTFQDLPTQATTRAVNTHTTASINANATENFTISELGSSGIFFSVETDVEAWIRFYTTDAARTADTSRTITQDPDNGSGVLLEVIHSPGDTSVITPSVNYFNGDTTQASALYASVTNTAGTSAVITVTTTGIKLVV